MHEVVRELIQREADDVKFGGELFEGGLQPGLFRGEVAGRAAVGGFAHRLVEIDAGSAAPFGVGVDAFGEDAAEEKGVVAEVRAQEKGLLRGCFGEDFEEVGDVAKGAGGGLFAVGAVIAKLVGVGEGGEHGGDVIGEGAVIEPGLEEDAAGEDVEVEGGGELEAADMLEYRAVEHLVIEDGVAFGFVAEEFDEANGIAR